MPKIQLTQNGFDDLKIEHKNLLTNKKPKAIDRLSKARSMGDLSENSEYTAAKEELAFVEGRVQEIHEGGMPYGEEIAVFDAGRTDVDPEEDVPEFDFPTDENIKTDRWTKKHSGRKLFRVSGELW